MEYRQLGHSGLGVSALSLGSWLTYESIDEQDALAVISCGLAAGINFLDDARPAGASLLLAERPGVKPAVRRDKGSTS